MSQREGSLLVLNAEFDCDVRHHLLGDIHRGTRTIEYYWLDRWYNIFQFLNDENRRLSFTCNIKHAADTLQPTY